MPSLMRCAMAMLHGFSMGAAFSLCNYACVLRVASPCELAPGLKKHGLLGRPLCATSGLSPTTASRS